MLIPAHATIKKTTRLSGRTDWQLIEHKICRNHASKRRRLEAARLSGDFAVLHQREGRDALDAELAGDLLRLVDVHFDEEGLASGLGGGFGELGAIIWRGPHQAAQKSMTTGCWL